MPSNFRTYGTQLVFNIPEMVTIQFSNPGFLYGYPIVHENYTTYKNWVCNYCTAVNSIEKYRCVMCDADIPIKYINNGI